MVECKNGFYDEDSDASPPLVRAEAEIISLDSLEPISVSAVSIDDDDSLRRQASVMSGGSDSSEAVAPITAEDRIIYSAVAGGVVGALVAGPIVGLVAGGAAAYYSQCDGAAGDVSRAMGEVAQTTSAKAKELNEKHQLADKSKEAADSAWRKIQEISKKHHVAEKSQAAVETAWEKFKEFDREHGVAKKVKEFAILCFKQLLKLVEYALERSQHLEEESTAKENDAETSREKLAQATAY